MRSRTFKTKSTGAFIHVSPESTETRGAEKIPVRSPALLLIPGGVLVFLTFMRFGLSELGWVVFAPFLVYLQEKHSWKHHLVLLATLIVAYLFAVAKIVTDGIPWAVVPMFAIPIAISYFIALSLAGVAQRRLGLQWGIYTFAAMVVVMGWVQYRFTPAASWAVLAHTQEENLPLIQLAALTGLGGISFIVALGSGLVAAVWRAGFRAMRKDLLGFGVLLIAALLYGEWRLSHTAPGEMIRIGGVVSPVTRSDFQQAAAQVDVVRSKDNELFACSEKAVALGARVVVWNEVATVVSASGEQALASRGQSFAKNNNVLLLMAYAVVVSTHPLYYVNKYRIYLPDGTMADEYLKRHPVPGDPHDAGKAHAQVVAFNGIKVSGGICYDYSFPEIAMDNAMDGADLALVPASDWHGIDPQHGLMARMNAVASGLPMIRPVRAATSIASDPYGRLLGSMPADGSGDGVLVAEMRGGRVPTIYVQTGEVVPLIALAFCVWVIGLLLRRARSAQAEVRSIA